MALDADHRLHARRSGIRHGDFCDARLRRHGAHGRAGRHHRRAVGREGRVRGGGDAAHLRRRRLSQGERARGRLRLRDGLQPDQALSMTRALAARLYWPGWVLATVLTGLVAGFMLGHALVLGRFVEWLLTAGAPAHGLLYPAFRATSGRGGLTVFYAVCGLQVISVVAFLVLALASGRARGAAALAAAAGVLWRCPGRRCVGRTRPWRSSTASITTGSRSSSPTRSG